MYKVMKQAETHCGKCRRESQGLCWQVHPVTLGVFNFVNAWSMMLWPLMLADKKGAAVKNRFPLYLGTQVGKLIFPRIMLLRCIVKLQDSKNGTASTQKCSQNAALLNLNCPKIT